jgi:hypothetical protein
MPSKTDQALQSLADSVHRLTKDLNEGDAKLKLFTGPSGSGHYPLLIGLERTDTMEDLVAVGERMATAFERIATALETGRVTHTE